MQNRNMKEAEAFVAEFHNLNGTTRGEKKKSLFQLFQKNQSLHQNKTLSDAVTSQLTARNHLERLFLVEFLIYYHRFEELSKEFFKGDDVVLSKISKHTWFFERVFREEGPHFVDHFLPTLSHNVRLKILNKLPLILDEEDSDAIFDALRNRYGVFVATSILTSCSCAKIEQVLKSHPIKLWTSQLKVLYNKSPDLIYIYLEERVRYEGNVNFLERDPIFFFIATKNPDMFCILQEKYKLKYCRLGKRTTKNFIRCKKDCVIAKPELFVTTLNGARMVRTLGQDFRHVCFKLFPKCPTLSFRGWSHMDKLLKYYPKRRRFALFRDTFNQIFYDQLESHHQQITDYVFEMMADVDEREKLVRQKLDHGSEYHWTKYLKAQTCIDIIKQKLNVFSQLTERVENISLMTKTCLINEDLEALITVLQLLCNRFKNDDKSVHNKFLQVIALPQYRRVLQAFTETHWTYIKQIFAKVGSPDRFNQFQAYHVYQYLEFAHKNGTLTEEEMVNLLANFHWFQQLDNLKHINPVSERHVLLNLMKIAPRIVKKNAPIEKIDVGLIEVCHNYNSRHPDGKISIFDHPRLLQSLEYALNHADQAGRRTVGSAVERIICTKNRNEKVEQLTRLYWDNLDRFASVDTIVWFLEHRPEVVLQHVDTLIRVSVVENFRKFDFRGTKRIWRIIKCYTHLGIDQKLIEYCTSKLTDKDFDRKNSLAEPLSVLMSPQDFIRLVQTYKPTTPTVNVYDAQFQLQRYLLKNLVKTNEPESATHVIMQFCSDDYVASCLSPLHSCLYRIPLIRLKPILDKLCNTGAVSVKKHGFYFVCVTQDESTVLESLKSCRLSQSIVMTYRYFVKNPSQACWEILKSKLAKVDNKDHFTSIVLVNKPAPTLYKTVYFEAVFTIFREKKNRFTQVLLDKLQKETVGQLTPQFFDAVKDEFLTWKKSELIFARYLIFCPHDHKFGVAFDILRNFKEKQWSLRARDCRDKLNKLVVAVFEEYMEWDSADGSLVTRFASGFHEIFPPVEAFEEFVIISLMVFKSRNGSDLCKSVVDLNNRLMATYGKLTLTTFASCLEKALPKFYPEESDVFEFYCTLLDYKESVEDVLLVLSLLPRSRPTFKRCVEFYNKALDCLKQVDDETVQMHLHLYLKQQQPL